MLADAEAAVTHNSSVFHKDNAEHNRLWQACREDQTRSSVTYVVFSQDFGSPQTFAQTS